MDVKLLSPSEWASLKGKLIAFAVRFGDNRLTASGIRELHRLRPEALAVGECGTPAAASAAPSGIRMLNAAQAAKAKEPGGNADAPLTAVAVAVAGGKLAAFAFAAQAGERACLVVVRPELRGQGAGSALLKALHGRFGRLACSVAADNPASMQMCFRAGMKAVGMSTGPTGKPTLRFEC
ncbi:GNAT family N-acetyltransferase [Paenibacillus sp. sptzw28]|uniref:GNAT family N-acetyltransferase n=1 Tax=Paenibacillus sp. sptzw28 TaxID=715179 RepID=UPI001C6F25B4|nr:GNAT family N-acetyltransferase [Paenibacillus sp. sptzw28]QYR20411.1 GNAT family N-acetyltransferase [Paenibacillus sp. sptzw28]